MCFYAVLPNYGKFHLFRGRGGGFPPPPPPRDQGGGGVGNTSFTPLRCVADFPLPKNELEIKILDLPPPPWEETLLFWERAGRNHSKQKWNILGRGTIWFPAAPPPPLHSKNLPFTLYITPTKLDATIKILVHNFDFWGSYGPKQA